MYIVSNEEQEERASNQTTVAVILVIAWCLVAVIAFFYYKQTKTGIKNDTLFLDYSHVCGHCSTWYARVATLHYIFYFIGSAKESKEEGNQKVTTPSGTNEEKNEGVQPAAVEPERSLASDTTSTGNTTSDKIYPNLSDQIDQSNWFLEAFLLPIIGSIW